MLQCTLASESADPDSMDEPDMNARLETMLAARTLQGEERQFDVGLRTSTDVLDAQSRLADAQSREVQALSAYQIALIDIAFATRTLPGPASPPAKARRIARS